MYQCTVAVRNVSKLINPLSFVSFHLQSRDLLAIRVKDPASFGISEAIPLKPDLDRETDLLPGAKLFSLVQFPYNKHKAPRPLEIAIGLKYKEPYNQGKFSIVSELS